MNTHRNSKMGCQFMINHYKGGCPGNTDGFKVQIIVKLEGNGYSQGTVDEEAKKTRLKVEDEKIKLMRTVYPYGLNSRVKNKNCKSDNLVVGKLFPNIPRIGPRPTRNTRRSNIEKKDPSPEEFLDTVRNYLESNLKIGFNRIRILINTLKKNTIKKIAQIILNKSDDLFKYKECSQWYDYILDLIDTKIYKVPDLTVNKIAPRNICVIKYVNKGLDIINMQKVMKDKEIMECMPVELRERENVPLISYKLGPTIRNKLFNYKETVENITLDKNDINCNCHNSEYRDLSSGHIITGDLRIIKNNKLRKLMCKGPNYREKTGINYKKCREAIEIALKECIGGMSRKFKMDSDAFDAWKYKILDIVEEKIKSLKKDRYHPKVEKTLENEEVKKYLDEIKSEFVLVPIDKASNNIALICKKYYIEKVLNEVGFGGNPSATYEISKKTPEEIIFENKEICDKLNIEMDKIHFTLPKMYWMPKLHKNPIGARFIIASKTSCNKPLSKIITIVFKMIYNQIENFHNKSKFCTNFDLFWVIQNSNPIIDILDKINKKSTAKSISTFDFSTLYTKISHEDLTTHLNDIINLAIKGGNKRYKVQIKQKQGVGAN